VKTQTLRLQNDVPSSSSLRVSKAMLKP